MLTVNAPALAQAPSVNTTAPCVTGVMDGLLISVPFVPVAVVVVTSIGVTESTFLQT